MIINQFMTRKISKCSKGNGKPLGIFPKKSWRLIDNKEMATVASYDLLNTEGR